MHGAGNDYIYVNTLLYNIDVPSKVARAWSDRHKGIGSDGLVLIGKSPVPEADFTMRIYNADGSEAMMCGNASRCVGKYLYEKKLTTQTQIRLLTLSGVKVLDLHLASEGIVDFVTVNMGEPLLENEKQFAHLSAWEIRIMLFLWMIWSRWISPLKVRGWKTTLRFPNVATSSLPLCVQTVSECAFGNVAVASRWLVEQEPVRQVWLQY